MKLLDGLYIRAMVAASKVKENVKDFLDSQEGVSNVVATIVVLLITVLLIAVFWDRLKDWVNGIMDQVFGTTFDDSGLK